MVDVNENIVKEYFELVKGCWIRSNIKYGTYHSDIDLLAINKQGNVIDIEVKWKSRITINDGDSRENGFNYIVHQISNSDRDKKIYEVTGKRPLKKIFVTTKHFLTKKKFDFWISKFKKKGIDVMFFENIIQKLIETIQVKGRYDSPVLQTIRILKYFDLIKN